MQAAVATVDNHDVAYTVHGEAGVVWATCNDCTIITDNTGVITNCSNGSIVLLTYMHWETSSTASRLIPFQSFMMRASGGGTMKPATITCGGTQLSYVSKYTLTDCSEEWKTHQCNRIQDCRTAFMTFVNTNNIVLHGNTHCFIAPSMMQSDFVSNTKLHSSGGLGGWPQLRRLTFTPQVYWVRAVAYAVQLTAANISMLLTPDNNSKAYRVLITSALTAFAGNYPSQPETSDDRSLGSNKLDTNRDCDDMAMTVVACEAFLRSIGPQPYTTLPNAEHASTELLQLAEQLHLFMYNYYTGAAVVICKAMPKAANPLFNSDSATPTGHVFAILTTAPFLPSGGCPAMFKNADVIEATRQSHPFSEPLSTISPHFARHDWKFGQGGITCLKPLVTAQYPSIICAHTATQTFIAVHPKTMMLGCSLKLLLEGGASVHRLQVNALQCKVPALFDNIAHSMHLDTVDEACSKYLWAKKLGTDSRGSLTDTLHLSDWDITGAPQQMGAPGFTMTNCTQYAFITAANGTYSSSAVLV